MMSCLVIFFFFFQAEDGIRDDLVTGVQTCALPILFRWLIYAIKGSITMSPSCWGGLFGSLLTWRCDWTSRFHHVPLVGSDSAVAIMATLQKHPFPHLASDTPIYLIHSTPLPFPSFIKFYPFIRLTSFPSCH